MALSRREFVILSSAALAGCGGTKSDAVKRLVAPLDAGPETDYTANGVYSAFGAQGFFMVRRRGELVAISSVCTHRACRLKPRPNGSFICPCHGSTFGPDGNVNNGPATRGLPRYGVTVDARGHVIVSPVS